MMGNSGKSLLFLFLIVFQLVNAPDSSQWPYSSTTTSSSDAYLFDSELDEKFEKEPNTYWSVSKARETLIKQDWDCGFQLENIRKAGSYEFENDTYKTTDETQIKFNWRISDDDFGSCLCLAANDLRVVIKELTKTFKYGNWSVVPNVAKKKPDFEKKIKTYMNRAEVFINLVFEFVETMQFKHEKVNKWENTRHTNQLLFRFPSLLAHYMMVPYQLREIPSTKIISTLFEIVSLDYGHGIYAGRKFGPWLITQIYNVGCDETIYKKNVIDGEEYGKMMTEIALPYSEVRFGKGLHRDGTYMSRKTVLGFEYMKLMCPSYTMYAYSFDKNLANKPTPLLHWKRVSSLLLHPNINRGPPGMLSFDSNFYSNSDPEAPLGGKIMPLARILRVNTLKCRFFVRGVTEGLGFLEAHYVKEHLDSQYSVQSRIPYSAESNIPIPDFKYAYGLIFSTDHDDYIELGSYSNRAYTYIYFPTKNSWSIVGSLGLTEETRQDFLLQNYELPQYGKYRVYEYIRYSHRNKTHVLIDLEIDNRKGDKELGIRYSLVDVDPHKLEQSKHELQVLKIPTGKIARLQHIVNLENCTIRTILEEKLQRNPMWPDFDANKTILPLDEFENSVDKWTLNTQNNVVSSSVSGEFMCAAPLPHEEERESIRDGTFVFYAEDRNAYVHRKYVYKKSNILIFFN